MGKLSMPIGKDIFSKLREEGFYYIDKTGFIKQIIKSNAEVTLITRPRRFGKSLNLSMLDCFFNIEKDSKKWFEGLKISEYKELCDNWMNKYPTIFLSFKDVKALNYFGAEAMLWDLISDFCIEHSCWLKCENIEENDKIFFRGLQSKVPRKLDSESLKSSLIFLCKMAYKYYGKEVIMIIDEYDVPMSKGMAEGYYREITDLISTMLSKALKSNPYLKLAVMTGCLRIAKESIFTGLNNLYVNSISDCKYNEYFGFTDSEIDKLLYDTNFTEKKSDIKDWYDGYHFGNAEVYCPWDVICYISYLQDNPQTDPKNFWANTSGNDIIKQFLDSDIEVTDDFESLLKGEYIEKKIYENITYDELTDSEENFWSVLYLTGYLTTVNENYSQNFDNTISVKLKIPNKEVRSIFENSISKWFKENVAKDDRTELFSSVWNGDAERLTEIIGDYLYETISYYDYHENYYHAFLAGLLSGMKGYIVNSNSDVGLGRADIILKNKSNKRIAIFEIKRAKSEEELSKLCDEALRQIDKQQYAKPFKRETVVKLGVAFYQKVCLVKVGDN